MVTAAPSGCLPIALDTPSPGERLRARSGDGIGVLARQRSRLWRTSAALAAVRAMGLDEATIRRFGLGLKDAYLSRISGLVTDRALIFPLIGFGGVVRGRFACLNLEGVTTNPPHPVGWGAGPPLTCFSRVPFRGATLLMVDSLPLLWLLGQILDQAGGPIVVGARSHTEGVPSDWDHAPTWDPWARIVVAFGPGDRDEALARTLASHAPGDIYALGEDAAATLLAEARAGLSAGELRRRIAGAPAWVPRPTFDLLTARNVAAEPVSVEGAYRGGHLYYPVTIERQEPVDTISGAKAVGSSYVVQVLRSDGALLDVVTLPHPPGTPPERRVLALSDGTRILGVPRPSAHSSWRYPSMLGFVEARRAHRRPDHRSLAAIVADVEIVLRGAAWLPDPDGYAAIALFVCASYVHRVFFSLPILMLNGPRGSGKSELGAAIASLGFNGVAVGQVSGPGLIRLIDETRGLLVIDDLEGIAGSQRAGIGELAQVLKSSYKQSTSRKPIPGRGGRVRMYDFFGPKVLSNIGRADAVLGSRMLTVRTATAETGYDRGAADAADPDALRCELHVWAMCGSDDVGVSYQRTLVGVANHRNEIAAPLRALAALSGSVELVGRLERFLAGPVAPVAKLSQEERLRFAVDAARARGAGATLSLAQISLELAAAAPDDGPPSSESVGRLLLTLGLRRAEAAVERRRLQGVVTRIYELEQPGTDPERDPLAFCEERGCRSSPYELVCQATLPDLWAGKQRRSVLSSTCTPLEPVAREHGGRP